MSKESSVPETRTYDTEQGPITVPLRWRRYPVARAVAELIGADKDSGHNVPPPSASRRK